MNIRWGVIGCGGIAEMFVTCLLALPDAKLVAVASQTPGKAQKFAGKFGNPRAYSSYQQLVEDREVDIVYIATTHNFHYEHTVLCLNHGKHVLCEKPLSLNAVLAARMIELARKQQLFLMEAVWTRFLPATLKLQQVLKQGEIGEIHLVSADFSILIPFDPNHRLYNPQLGGGALLDLGIYPITFAQLVFQDFPISITAKAVIGQTGVDDSSSYLLEFAGGGMATLSSSCRSSSPHLALVTGSKGYVTIPDFYHPQELTIKREGKDAERVTEPYESLGYGHEAAEVMRCLRAGLKESPLLPWSVSLKIMQVLDSIRAQWGLSYPGE